MTARSTRTERARAEIIRRVRAHQLDDDEITEKEIARQLDIIMRRWWPKSYGPQSGTRRRNQ